MSGVLLKGKGLLDVTCNPEYNPVRLGSGWGQVGVFQHLKW